MTGLLPPSSSYHCQRCTSFELCQVLRGAVNADTFYLHFQLKLRFQVRERKAYIIINNLLLGTPLAQVVRNPSAITHAGPPITISDLLDRLSLCPTRSLPMLRTTCSLLASYLNHAPAEILLDTISETRNGFRPFLEQRKYAPNSIRTYVNHVNILLKSAETLGWRLDDRVPTAWCSVLALATEAKCIDIVTSMAKLRGAPMDVSIEDVDGWGAVKMQQGRSHTFVYARKKRFWKLLRDCGCTELTPKCIMREMGYGTPLEDFPPGLKADVLALIKWKQAPFALDRPKFARHRGVTALNLRKVVSQLYGFASKIGGRLDLNSLFELVQKPIVGEYVEWCINERAVKGRSLQCNLGLLGGALRQHPSYKSLNIDWLKPLLDGLPTESESETKKRKAAKYLEYAVVERIPKMIRAERASAEKEGGVYAARQTMNELMMKWIITLPWRQRNIRECRISGSAPNLFRGKIPPFSDLSKPGWVVKEEQDNPAAEFWQFRFSAQETKTGREVNALLPRQLIDILEEYLKDFRHHLLRGPDPNTLFVGGKGKAMTIYQMTDTVALLTMRHGSRRVTPHAFRDIVAYSWLKEHAKDYLTLSKMLWHRNINTTISIYGSRFNESNGVSAMEAWLDEREAKSS